MEAECGFVALLLDEVFEVLCIFTEGIGELLSLLFEMLPVAMTGFVYCPETLGFVVMCDVCVCRRQGC